ncbi:3-hydroxyacyl-CoA dehydrogenase, partial [Ensifer mexicanus]|nr:3-hydroxyacyl-CoA dehydrogenase [Sinorhizobium mexicanum]
MRPIPNDVKRVTCIGTGTIGGGFVAQFLASGYDVTAYDPGKNAQDFL